MASATTEKLQTMIKCPICFGKFNNPLALMCLHFYCESCVHGLKSITEGGKIGYNCPLCRMFTAKESLRPMYFVKELLEVLDQAEKGQSCDKCKSEKPTWRCGDCKENFCQVCRDHHDGFSSLKRHKWIVLDENSPPVVDKHVYCTQHPEELVKLYCPDCQQLICLLCNGTEHKYHPAQTIDDALKKAVPLVEERRNKVEQLIAGTEKALDDAKAHAHDLNKQYEQLETKIDQYTEETLTRVREDSKQLKQALDIIEKKQLAEVEENISTLEVKLKSEKNIVELSDTTLTTTRGASLLSAIHSGLGNSLASFIDRNDEYEPVPKPMAATFIQTARSEVNSVGDVRERSSLPSMTIPRRLTGVTQKAAQLIRTTETPFNCERFAENQDQLWCVEYGTNNIHIRTMAGDAVRTVTFDNTGKCRSVAQVPDGVIIAAENGLFVARQDGSAATRVEGGDFCDVSVMGDKVYALDDKRGKIVILKADSRQRRRYVRQSETSVHNYTSSDTNTIQVTENHVYVALVVSNTVVQYTHAGAYVATHGSHGTANGQLWCPLLSGVDPDGVLLIADCNNHRLQTLSHAGEWSRLPLNGLGQNPLCAVMTDDKLLVWLWNNRYQEFSLH